MRLILVLLLHIITLVISSRPAAAQQSDHILVPAGKEIVVPFDYVNGFIVVDATLNRRHKVRLLVDTGAENLILFDKAALKTMGIPSGKKITLKGADLIQEVQAQICRKIPLNLEGTNTLLKDFIVLNEDYMNLGQNIGTKIDGLLGGRLFWGLVLEINYEKMNLVLCNKGNFVVPTNPFTQKFDLELINNKPYLQSTIQLYNDEAIPVKLLLDTGSALGFLLFYNTHPELELPEKHVVGPLGRGLGGEIQGYLAMSKALRLNNSLFFKNFITHFQLIPENVDPEIYNNRNGLLGNPVLSRFRVMIDYVDNLLYLTANKNYNAKQQYDKSGLVIYATGKKLNTYTIKEVLKGTPAAEAGFIPGDNIRRINLFTTKLRTLGGIKRMLSGKEGKKLTFIIEREGQKQKKKIQLSDYLKTSFKQHNIKS